MSKLYPFILKNAIMPIADKAIHTNLIKYYHIIKKMNTWSKEDIYCWQLEKLRDLLEYSYNNTDYYRNLFNTINIKPKDINSIDDLSKLPILTKKIIRDNQSELISKRIDSLYYKKGSTGGSTGDPLIYLHDNDSWSFVNANNIFNWEKTGYRYGNKFLALGSTSLYVNKKPSLKHKIYYQLKNKEAVSGINMSDDVCEKYCELIKKENIKYIYGYASSIYLLAKYVFVNNINLPIKVCFSTSEVLKDIYRETIQKAFKCKIIDCYGANDGGITAFSHTKGFYEVGYNCIVRIKDPNENGEGTILLTDLFNYAMPFINYEIGDVIQIDLSINKQYNYNGQIINKILGRTSDIIILGNGHTLTGPGFTILFKDIPVDYYCIEKVDKNSIICWIIKLPSFNEKHEKLIYETLRKQCGEEISIIIKETQKPFLSPSGKALYFLNNE